MPKFSGVDSADISGFSGKSFVESASVPTSTSGILLYAGLPVPTWPIPGTNLAPYLETIAGFQLSSRTDIVDLKMGSYHAWALSSSGVLYSAGGSNNLYMGRSVSGTSYQYEFLEALTNVSKFAPHNNGCWAIKTDGTLWWAGAISQYATSSGTGQSTTSVAYAWKQYGSDTDWIDIDCYVQYPTVTMAIKGTGTSRYLYSCGYNQYGKTGIGTTSGLSYDFVRVKSDASTNWSADIASVSVGREYCAAITHSGELFCWGDGNPSGLGQGSSTDQLYPYEPTPYGETGPLSNWSKVFANHPALQVINTSGELYVSNRLSYIGTKLYVDTSGYLKKYGTDTDWQDIRWSTDYQEINTTVKKGGNWYFSGSVTSGDWSSSSSYSSLYTPTLISSVDQSGTISSTCTLAIPHKNQNVSTSNDDMIIVDS